MEEFVPNTPNLHYYFRNRISQLYSIMKDKKIDGLMLITSYDSGYSKLMEKFIKWVLFGYSSKFELEEMSIPSAFNETFIIITFQRIFIFSLSSTCTFFNEVCAKLNNVELFFPSKKDEELSENLEILKISKFVQWTQPIKTFGVPLDYEQRNNHILIDKWPLLTATALDCLKLGFFTMNHSIVDISKELEILYHKYDLNACSNLINGKTNLLEVTLIDFINYFQREPINKRLNRSEENLNENQNLELIRLNYLKEKNTTYEFLKDLPDPRVLYSFHSNINFDEGCSTDALFKIPYDFKFPAFHMTYENMDPVTGLRIGRTLFLYDLQKNYLDLNEENFKYEFIKSRGYDEAFYLFNLYYIIVNFSRKYQFDIILNKMNIDKAKDNLRRLLNDYIKNYFKENNLNYNKDYDIKLENILIHLKQYVILEQASSNVKYLKDNKIILLRFEVKFLLSPYTHRTYGSLLFADSFLYCYCELFNLTCDIIPFKFIQSSTQHFKQDINYNSQQILITLTNIKIKDIDYKALMFYKDEYNIPYMFPDSHEVNLDHNQMFNFYSGKINLYEDYITFSDDSVINIIISYNNIKNFYFLEELKYTIFLFEFEETDSLPLSGIVKNEMICYLRGNTERMRGYGRVVIDFMQNCPFMKGKVGILSQEKVFEYEIVIKTFNDNEYENLNYISNTYNLTNIGDILNEMGDYEYLKYNNYNFISYNEYKKLKNEAIDEIQEINENNTKDDLKKIMFIFGTDPLTINNIKNKLIDFANQNGIKSNIIIPPFSLFNFDYRKSILQVNNFYIDQIKKLNTNDKKEITFIFIYHSCNVLNLLYDITNQIRNFFNNYIILNISYAINYNYYKSNKEKNIVNKDFYYDDIINYIFIEEGMLKQEKISKYNKIVSLSNNTSKTFNSRSFYLNDKEMKKIFTDVLIGPKILKFYFNYYRKLKCNEVFYQNIFIPFKYMVDENLLKNFLKKGINNPLIKYFNDDFEHYPKDEEPKPKINDDNEYQKYLENTVDIAKVSEIEPVFIEIFGNIVIINDNNKNCKKDNREVKYINCNYKDFEILDKKNFNYLKEKNEIGIFVLGKNLIFNKNYDFYHNMIRTISGEFPKKREYKKKEDITKEERDNLNFANLTKPLPRGWVLEGPVVIDPQENIHYEHPYLEKFLDEYIKLQNNAINDYNKKIQNDINSLLI